jgi:hypothetical protein
MSTYDILFEEMISNPDNMTDLELFLIMHCNFPDFYKKICVTFFDRIIVPGLEMNINQYNKDNPSRQLVLKKPINPEAYLKKYYELYIYSGDLWPEGLSVQISSEAPNLGLMYGQAYQPALFPAKLATFLTDSFKTFPSANGISSNKDAAWYYYERAHRDLSSSAAIVEISREVSALNKGRAEIGPFANRYVQDMMEMVALVDQFFLNPGSEELPATNHE